MLGPLIFSLVALLLIVLIAYNIVQQYKQKIESEKRLAISKHRAVIVEVEELLLNATKIPFSKSLLMIFQNRIRNALLAMLQSSPSNPSIREHLKNTDTQIDQLKKNNTSSNENTLRTPDNDRDALTLLQTTKKIRAVLRSEHAKGKITTEVFVAEDHRVELIQLKINLENSTRRILKARNDNQFGSANQMIDKLLSILKGIPDKDAYFERKLTQLTELKNEIKAYLTEQSDNEMAALKAIELEKKNDIDVLFQEKKKW